MSLGPIIVPTSGASRTPPVTAGLVALYDFTDRNCFDANTSTTDLLNTWASPADGSAQADYDLQRGDASTTTTYPAVDGGGLTFDGGDYVPLQGSNTTFINSLHKDSAAFTLAGVLTLPAAGTTRYILATGSSTVTYGVVLYQQVAGELRLNVQRNTSGTYALTVNTDAVLPVDTPFFFMVSIDEAGGTGFFRRDNAYDQVSSANTFTATYSSPAANAASQTLVIGRANPALGYYLPSGTRMPWFAIYNTALSAANGDDLYSWLKDDHPVRFGL